MRSFISFPRGLKKSVFFLLCTALLLSAGALWAADDPDAMAKEARNELRAAQRTLFQGKYEEAAAKLEKAADLIDKIRGIDSSHSSLRSLEQRYKRLKKDVDRRLEKKRKSGKRASEPKKETGKKSGKPAGPKLPGGVTFRLKKIKDILDKGKPGDPFKLMEEIEKRYGDQIPPGHPEITAIKARLAALKSAREAQAAAEAAEAARLKALREKRDSQSKEWIDLLYPFINLRSDKYLISRYENNRATPEEKAKRAEIYKEAAAAFARYEKTGFPCGKTDRLLDIAERLADRLEEFRIDVHKADIEKASKPWLEKLDQFVSPYDTVNNRVNKNRLVVETTRDVAELKRLEALYERAKKVYAEYEKASFPLGKSPRLEVTAQELKKLIEKFPRDYRENALRVMADPGKALAEAAAFLERDTDWKTDPKKLPRVLDRKRTEAIGKLVDRAGSLDAAAAADLKRRFSRLLEENEKRKTVRAERTFMRPGKYAGADSAELKAKAQEIVKKKFAGASILRTSIINSDWKSERIWEWTDTTRTAVRYRVTRSITAQVAAKTGTSVSLHTIHLAKNKSTDGSWGPLYGHIMFTDAMLEKNVGR